MGVNSLPKTVTWQHRGCDLNLRLSATESSTLNANHSATEPPYTYYTHWKYINIVTVDKLLLIPDQ